MYLLSLICGCLGHSVLALGFTKGIGSTVWVFNIQNGKYGGVDEPPKPHGKDKGIIGHI